MDNKHKLECTEEEFEILHILVNSQIKQLEEVPRVDLLEPSRRAWVKIMKSIKKKLWAAAPQKGVQLGGLQFGRPARKARSEQRPKQVV